MQEYITDLNELKRKLDSKPVIPGKLVSEHSDEQTVKLYEYLLGIYGKRFIAGQQYLQSAELEDDVYFSVTGDLPAMRGYDLMDMDKKYGDDQVRRAIKWAKETGCIITMCWHWYAPDDLNDPENCCWSFYYKTTSYDHKTSFDILRAVEYGTPEYRFVVSRIDKAAAALKMFADEHIPVIFRPLHEANGAWFWWGRRKDDPEGSTEAYKKLWYMIFDRIENYHKLTNIIWVWNGQDKDMEVHPNTFDIVGDDIYSEREDDHSSQAERFRYMESLAHGKPVTLSECGYIPSPAEMRRDGVKWLWWLPWWGCFVYEMDDNRHPVFGADGKPVKTEKYMKGSFLRDTFADGDVVTLGRLPAFRGNDTLPEKFRTGKIPHLTGSGRVI
ncbi:MAG: beta-mannanase [Ruminiclostridium sp.]|nr:beta-mannanase [Ruminiclostridium sp.]